MIEIKLTRLPHGEGLPLPQYATEHAAGMDVVAAEDLTLQPGKRHAVATGFAIEIPHGNEVQVRPRSGLALKHGITCLNTPGTIDSDYRGEVKVILANLGDEPFEIRRGERIAQLVPAPVLRATSPKCINWRKRHAAAEGSGPPDDESLPVRAEPVEALS